MADQNFKFPKKNICKKKKALKRKEKLAGALKRNIKLRKVSNVKS